MSRPAQWQCLWLHSQITSPVGPLSHPGYSRLPVINQQLIKRLVSSRSSEGNQTPWVLQLAQPSAGLVRRPCSWSSAASCRHLGELVRMWLSSRHLQASIHPNRPGSFLCVFLPSFLWADPTDLSVLHLPLKAGCCIPPLAALLAKGRLGAQEGVRARAQRDRGAALSCSVPAAAARPLWWHVSGPAPCSSEGAAGSGLLLWHLWGLAASVS